MDTRIYLYQELMEADLHQIIRSGQALSDAHYQSFIYQICCGLKYIHSANVLHRDLKPGNLLVNADCDLKICDFGLARGYVDMPGADSGFMTEYVATRWYRAPEIMLSFQSYTKASEVGENDTERVKICVRGENVWYKRAGEERRNSNPSLFLLSTTVDMWSVGCIFAELLGGKPLFKGRDWSESQVSGISDRLSTPPSTKYNFSTGTARCGPAKPDSVCSWDAGRPDLETGWQRKSTDLHSQSSAIPQGSILTVFATIYHFSTALDLLERLLTFDPAARITVEEALEHPYLSLFHDPEDEPSHLQTCDFSFESLQTMEEMKEAIVAEVRSFKSKKHKLARLDMGFRRTNSNLTTPTPDRVRFDQDVGAQDDHGYAADLIASPMEVDPGLERELSGAGAH
ncbi:hypothetical protein BC938DRAFT_478184 [Jimgerdemannia flammicorona]|uniref:Protein kinase domain-containing protein n=1 Tax=Jimgerdemannia flammicorona TaxID=994334 RepID=A0A433QNA3_9FUNG|nr:hypothetical protein BC938DRAFT_478184 [Jimgerdemannia flammicorona]